jgi:hydrogenase maturation protein HypF
LTTLVCATCTRESRRKNSQRFPRGVNSPLTSSVGRLFDAVASLIGVRDDTLYEGQAAIELEAIADPGESGSYRFDLLDGSPLVIDPLPVVEGILDDMAGGLAAAAISARFHRALVDATVTVARAAAEAAGTRRVALSGGVFMNRLLLSGCVRGLSAAGLQPLLPLALPVNDGGISYGQAVVALSRAAADAV